MDKLQPLIFINGPLGPDLTISVFGTFFNTRLTDEQFTHQYYNSVGVTDGNLSYFQEQDLALLRDIQVVLPKGYHWKALTLVLEHLKMEPRR